MQSYANICMLLHSLVGAVFISSREEHEGRELLELESLDIVLADVNTGDIDIAHVLEITSQHVHIFVKFLASAAVL